ncbi:hypothetical protein [Limosilactobacillus coleohominis]|uniref:hypothetical protein n=1 Tax=Limosilactobacillus coleohominis TaxID=181675 RepID=UPI002A90D5B0|nr:hypothetical protein [Limosilactobacillus coleohominis]MDY5628904.1 hypothetical protein [Limosilactobacillus coleohominis]
MSKKLDHSAETLLKFIPVGMEQPRPLKELVNLTGWNSRKVRLTINRLIVEYKQPIGAVYEQPNNGYFLIEDEKERARALAPLLSQVGEMSKRINTISTAELGK